MRRPITQLALTLLAPLVWAGCEKSGPSQGSNAPLPGRPSATTSAPGAGTTPDQHPSPGETAGPGHADKETEMGKTSFTTPSGVVVEELVIGAGEECKPHQVITAYYRGTFKSDGKEFESNFGGEPLVYPLDELVAGWQEGIPGMKVGGKRRLTIPYQLGYGERGFPPDIPPRADLVFEIELIGVK